MNKIVVHGRLVRDPDLKNANGYVVCKFTVAENQRFDREKANFHECEAWGKTGEFVDKYFRKGSEIVISGELRQRNYEAKDGTKRTAWSINVDQVDFCGKAGDNAGTTRAADIDSSSYTPSPASNFEELAKEDDPPF